MKTTLGQYCINVSNMERAVAFYENAIGLEITNKVEEENFREVILGTEGGARIQLAYHFGEDGPMPWRPAARARRQWRDPRILLANWRKTRLIRAPVTHYPGVSL